MLKQTYKLTDGQFYKTIFYENDNKSDNNMTTTGAKNFLTVFVQQIESQLIKNLFVRNLKVSCRFYNQRSTFDSLVLTFNLI